MITKTNIDERITELSKEIIEQINELVEKTEEKEIRLNSDIVEKVTSVYTVTKDTVILKKFGLFNRKQKMSFINIPFFILSDILDMCEDYIHYYAHQKEYEKNIILKWFREYKGNLVATEKNFRRLCRKLKNKYPYFIFKEQKEFIVRDQLEYYL